MKPKRERRRRHVQSSGIPTSATEHVLPLLKSSSVPTRTPFLTEAQSWDTNNYWLVQKVDSLCLISNVILSPKEGYKLVVYFLDTKQLFSTIFIRKKLIPEFLSISHFTAPLFLVKGLLLVAPELTWDRFSSVCSAEIKLKSRRALSEGELLWTSKLLTKCNQIDFHTLDKNRA